MSGRVASSDAPAQLPAPSAATHVPRLVHQLWIGGREMPDRFRDSPEAWRRLHPDWSYRLWSDAEVEALLREHSPELEALYRRCRLAQRTDVARYAILHRHGGVYCDLDVIPVRSFEPLLVHAVVLPDTEPLGVSTDLMIARPGHPFLAELLQGLPASMRRWDRALVPHHFRMLLSAGPLYLTLSLRRSAHREEVHRLPGEVYSSQDPSRVYVLHVPGNTWARWDTHLFTFLWKRWRWPLAAVALLVLARVLT